MDETQKRKLSAKEFIEKNSKIGALVIGIFILLFVIYFSFVYFYSKNQTPTSPTGEATSSSAINFSFSQLLPIFTETDNKDLSVDENILNSFTKNNLGDIDQSGEGNDVSKLLKIESSPVLSYVIYDKSISIKNYIKNRPKVCTEKLEPVTAKDSKSVAVKNFQKLLQSMDDYTDTPDTGVLDDKTREKIYIFQKRYAEVLYKNKDNKEPTRVIDKETAHFLNLLCGLDVENSGDFIMSPTVRYVTKENREIYDYNPVTKEKSKLSTKNATGTEDVVFSKDGNFLVSRYGTDAGIISEFFNLRTGGVTRLEKNVTTLDFNDKGVLVYGVPGESGLYIKTYDENKNIVKTLAQIPLNEWNIYWIDNTTLGISNKPSAYAEGIYMQLDTNSKKLTRLAGPLLGLAVQKTTNGYTILSTGGQGDEKTLLLNNKTKTVGDLSIKTFAEKCSETIFANGIFCALPKNLDPNKILPDDWYKGKFTTEDILVYKSINGTSTAVISYLENRPISIVNLNINKNGIFFIDQNTLNLYSLEL